jgi:stearoyl-CoA desaturase (delta-9 desaturase)
MFRRYYLPFALTIGIILPTILPAILWHESLLISYMVVVSLRLVASFHAIGLVNSVAHTHGSRPYDKNIRPVDNIFVSLKVVGEGFHNFHHTFPQDYAASEHGFHYFNLSKAFIDLMAFFGLGIRIFRNKFFVIFIIKFNYK